MHWKEPLRTSHQICLQESWVARSWTEIFLVRRNSEQPWWKRRAVLLLSQNWPQWQNFSLCMSPNRIFILDLRPANRYQARRQGRFPSLLHQTILEPGFIWRTTTTPIIKTKRLIWTPHGPTHTKLKHSFLPKRVCLVWKAWLKRKISERSIPFSEQFVDKRS